MVEVICPWINEVPRQTARKLKMELNKFMQQLEATFGSQFARQVEINLRKEICQMAKAGSGKALYAVYVVDQEADTVERPDYVIATGEENARYKVLHSKGVADPDEVDVFVQYIGTLKTKED